MVSINNYYQYANFEVLCLLFVFLAVKDLYSICTQL